MVDQTNSTRSSLRLRFRTSMPHSGAFETPARSGFTLIEMMVVLLIIVIMTSIMIPVMSSASDTRRAREGARVLSTMLASAQTQAQVSGRPSAVWIQRLTSSTGASVNSAAAIDLYLADVPPPYLGDTLGSLAQLPNLPSNGTAQVNFSNTNLTLAGVQAGDLLRFEGRGEMYVLTNIQTPSSTTSTATITPIDSTLVGSSQAFPPTGIPNGSPPGTNPIGAPSMPFQIYRRPVKSMTSAVQLSDGAAIDLAWSGADPNWGASTSNVGPNTSNIQKDWWPTNATGATWFTKPFFVPTSSNAQTNAAMNSALNPMNLPNVVPTSPFDTGAIIITFNSSGALDLVYELSVVPGPTPGQPNQLVGAARPYSGVYLLVGKIENVPLATQTSSAPTGNMQSPNMFDGNSRWVAIGRTGLVTTSETAYTANTSTTPVATSLRLARSSQNSIGN